MAFDIFPMKHCNASPSLYFWNKINIYTSSLLSWQSPLHSLGLGPLDQKQTLCNHPQIWGCISPDGKLGANLENCQVKEHSGCAALWTSAGDGDRVGSWVRLVGELAEGALCLPCSQSRGSGCRPTKLSWGRSRGSWPLAPRTSLEEKGEGDERACTGLQGPEKRLEGPRHSRGKY